jgi:hypothetical protein
VTWVEGWIIVKLLGNRKAITTVVSVVFRCAIEIYRSSDLDESNDKATLWACPAYAWKVVLSFWVADMTDCPGADLFTIFVDCS